MNDIFNGSFKFIDLFAGIGGFHIAMVNLGGECVMASEIDIYAIETYKENYGMDSQIDITKIDENDVPDHDVLCAGFPCQSFSKAGGQEGFKDTTRGTLFFDIARILEAKQPKFIILENVRNLVSHNGGNTWDTIKETLVVLNYTLTEEPIIMSPHQLGIPQIRERVYILGIHNSLNIDSLNINIPQMKKSKIYFYKSNIIDSNMVNSDYYISEYEEFVLNAWDEFYKGIKEVTIGFPIWSDEFKTNNDVSALPSWKRNFVEKNRNLYLNNKEFIDKWLEKYCNLQEFKPTDRKFEWQAGGTITSLWDGIIQFRPSGIRVKRPDTFPALVAMVHIPIIGKLKRRLTPREAARLQSFPDTFIPNSNSKQAYKQFGNAVNVDVVEFLAKQLFDLELHKTVHN